MSALPAAPPKLSPLSAALADIKLAHSVFALPFALLACFLARPSGMTRTELAARLGLVVVCMVLARTWAMLVNRLADARFDAQNPRTARRAIPAGRLSAAQGRAIAAACAALFLGACALFLALFGNPWPLILGAPVLGWIALYSFTKRFTAAAHLFLGSALAVSPLAAAIAVHPPALAATPALWFIAGMVLCWVAGFDVIYALQDLDFDRRAGLHSIPARLGPRGAAWVSRALHVCALALLIAAAGSDARFGPLFMVSVAGVGALLVLEHAVLVRRGLAGLDMAFFTINGVVSCLLGAAGIADLTVL